jgi:hypothetical protein
VGQIYFGDKVAKWVRFTSALTREQWARIKAAKEAQKEAA